MRQLTLSNSPYPYEGTRAATIRVAATFTHDGIIRHARVSPRVLVRVEREVGADAVEIDPWGVRHARFYLEAGGAITLHAIPTADYNPGVCPCCQ